MPLITCLRYAKTQSKALKHQKAFIIKLQRCIYSLQEQGSGTSEADHVDHSPVQMVLNYITLQLHWSLGNFILLYYQYNKTSAILNFVFFFTFTEKFTAWVIRFFVVCKFWSRCMWFLMQRTHHIECCSIPYPVSSVTLCLI